MNYKIHMAFARNSEERYGAAIGSELWHESGTRYGEVTIKILWCY